MQSSKVPSKNTGSGRSISGSIPSRDQSNPDHHIYDNNGILWLHCTVHREDHTKHRVRISLRTHDYAVARRRRDFAMRHLSGVVGAPQIIHPDFSASALQAAA